MPFTEKELTECRDAAVEHWHAHNGVKAVNALSTKLKPRGRVSRWLWKLTAKRPCKIVHRVGTDGQRDILFERYHLFAIFGIEVVLHRFLRSDADQPHNHPWGWAWSWMLSGAYMEERVCGWGKDGAYLSTLKTVGVGSINRLRFDTFHRVIMPADHEAWTLFVHGPVRQRWGFLFRNTDGVAFDPVTADGGPWWKRAKKGWEYRQPNALGMSSVSSLRAMGALDVARQDASQITVASLLEDKMADMMASPEYADMKKRVSDSMFRDAGTLGLAKLVRDLRSAPANSVIEVSQTTFDTVKANFAFVPDALDHRHITDMARYKDRDGIVRFARCDIVEGA